MPSSRSKSQLRAAGLNAPRLRSRQGAPLGTDRERKATIPSDRPAAPRISSSPGARESSGRSRLVAQDLFSWNARNVRNNPPKDRKRLKIPMQAFGPSFKVGRLTNPRVRLRFKEFFVFMDGPRLPHRDDTDDVSRFRTRFLFLVGGLVVYSLWKIFGA